MYTVCERYLKINNNHKFSAADDMDSYFKECFSHLPKISAVEEILIAKVFFLMTMYMLDVGSYAYKEQVLFFSSISIILYIP